MEIRPILSAMFRNKTGAVLVALQTALTLAVVVNSLFIIQQRVKHINRPNGMDVENIISVQSQGFGADYAHEATVRQDLETLRAMPGVIDAMPTNSVPLSGSGSAQDYRSATDDAAVAESANYYMTDGHAVNALGIKLARGRTFNDTEVRFAEEGQRSYFESQVIITQALADKLFPDTEALGKLLYNQLGQGAEIIGIIERMHGAWVSWDGLEQVMLRPTITTGPRMRYLVRTEPGQRDRLIPRIEEVLSASSSTRIVRRVQPMTEIVARTYSGDRAMATVLTVVIGLLVSVTGLGIVGLASFSVRQRTKQIGTRRAIGARKMHILRYFLIENWLMTTMGVAAGTLLAFALNYHLATEYSLEKLDPVFVPLGIFALWGLGLLSVIGPALRASRISPAIATRTV